MYSISNFSSSPHISYLTADAKERHDQNPQAFINAFSIRDIDPNQTPKWRKELGDHIIFDFKISCLKDYDQKLWTSTKGRGGLFPRKVEVITAEGVRRQELIPSAITDAGIERLDKCITQKAIALTVIVMKTIINGESVFGRAVDAKLEFSFQAHEFTEEIVRLVQSFSDEQKSELKEQIIKDAKQKKLTAQKEQAVLLQGDIDNEVD